jgi:DNA/RNA-binding domain of Phe-tRNA-synthetase-like protein
MTNGIPRCSWVDAQAAALGVRFRAAEVHGVRPAKKSEALEAAKRAIVFDVLSGDVNNSEELSAYRRLLDSVGATSEIASPQALLQFVLEHGKLPNARNTVVDAYNMISLKTLTVVSAHDLDRVEGNPRIEMTVGNEVFYPLKSQSPITLPAGQFAGVADNHILCQLNCKQSELSKVTLDTRNLLVYVQGNAYTSEEYLEWALRIVCEEVVRFNGGEAVYLDIRSFQGGNE